MRRILSLFTIAVTIFGLVTPLTAAPVQSPALLPPAEVPGELKVDIVVDERYIRKVLGNKVAALFTDQLLSADPGCRAGAVLVARQAVDNVAYWTTSVDLMKETARGIELGGKLGGAKTVEKAGHLAFLIAESFEMDEPAAALGQAFVAESTDWLTGKLPKSQADQLIKTQAGKAKDQIISSLFPYKKTRARTHQTTVGECSVTVTSEIQWPQGRDKDRGGIWLHIDGDCGCKKPLTLNSSYLPPTTFQGQLDDIKNCGLGKFAIHAFLPMERLETTVSYEGIAIDLQDFAKKSADLYGWIHNSLSGIKNDKGAIDVAKELAKLTNKATTVSPTLVLKPIFTDAVEINGEPYAKCNDCGGSEPVKFNPVEEVKAVPEEPCKRRCSTQYDAWMAAALNEAEKRKLHDDTEISRSIRAAQSELNTAVAAQDGLEQRLITAEERVKGLQGEAARKGIDVRELGATWTNAVTARDGARSNAEAGRRDIKRRETKLDQLKQQDATFEAGMEKLTQKTTAAKAAYEECATRCRQQELNAVKPGTEQIDACLIGQWLSWTLREDMFKGATISVTGDGMMAIQYDHVRPSNGTITFAHEFNGSARAPARTRRGQITVMTGGVPTVTETLFKDDGTPQKPYTISGLGPLSPPNFPMYMDYQCDATTLRFQSFGGEVVFKRAGTLPR